MRVVLASGSPRRRELLETLGLAPTIVRPDIDETPRGAERPVAYVERVAREKVAVVGRFPDALVIGADTTVELDGEIIGKPDDRDHARHILSRLSGRIHRVHTGVALRLGEHLVSDVETTMVELARLDRATLDWYVATGEPIDKAGAYALQGAGGALVSRVEGSVSNVVGLPLTMLVRLARDLGAPLLAGG